MAKSQVLPGIARQTAREWREKFTPLQAALVLLTALIVYLIIISSAIVGSKESKEITVPLGSVNSESGAATTRSL